MRSYKTKNGKTIVRLYKMRERSKKTETRFYQSFTDDFVESKKQSFPLPEEYEWIHRNIFYRIGAKCIYVLFTLFAFPYCRFWLHIKFENRSVLRQCAKSGYFLYGNHTQPMGDVFIPMSVLSLKRGYIVASPANLGIPVLGPILPMLGALPLPDTVAGMKKFREAVRLRIAEERCVVFYPEAHVWPWYTGIRPFSSASFGFPADSGAPSFCMTTTYQKRKYGKKPGITVYLDGPFYPEQSLHKMKRKERLRDEIYDCMLRRSRASTYQYIKYEKET